jgi:hypothetical protein
MAIQDTIKKQIGRDSQKVPSWKKQIDDELAVDEWDTVNTLAESVAGDQPESEADNEEWLNNKAYDALESGKDFRGRPLTAQQKYALKKLVD